MKLIYSKEQGTYISSDAGSFEGEWVRKDEMVNLERKAVAFDTVANFLASRYAGDPNCLSFVHERVSIGRRSDMAFLAPCIAQYLLSSEYRDTILKDFAEKEAAVKPPRNTGPAKAKGAFFTAKTTNI